MILLKYNIPVRIMLLTVVCLMLFKNSFSANNQMISNKIKSKLPQNAKIVATKIKNLTDQDYVFIKYYDNNSLKSKVFDSDGLEVKEKDLKFAYPETIGKRLKARIEEIEKGKSNSNLIRVNIALKTEEVSINKSPVKEEVIINELGEYQIKMKNVLLTKNDEKELLKISENHLRTLRTKKKEKIKSQIEKLISKFPFLDQCHPGYTTDDLRSSVTADLSVHEISLLQNENEDISGIELYEEPTDDISEAMSSTNVDPYAFSLSNEGDGIGIFLTESGCPDSGHITNYYKVSGNRTDHSENTSAIVRAVSPDCYVRCKGGAVLPNSDDIEGKMYTYDIFGRKNYIGSHDRIYIITRSNGSGNDGSYNIIDRDWDNFVYDNGIAIFKSAGNNGNSTGYLSSPGQGLNIISVGNYNDATDAIASSSSFKDPLTKNDKPEICAPGTNITAGGHTMSGTSMSCPHAAAFAADLMSSYSFLKSRPYYLKAFLMSGAINEITGGIDKVGVGGINFYRNYYNSIGSKWEGNNGSFSIFDSQDSDPNNGYIDWEIDLNANSSNVRIVLAWLNRGSYIYDHRNDAHPIGTDLDFWVESPSGNWVDGSYSWDNSFEYVQFDPTETGTYKITINRYANQDTTSKLHMGLWVRWW